MLLSVIIVNYNVKYFLEQCLCSVQAAITNIEAEVMVVDNCSADGSIEYLQPFFSWVTFIKNNANDGFAKANNKALQLAKGEYILFLNPDTILAEDTLQQCIEFLKNKTDSGAIGVRMVDGSGAFLPESKRAFSSPLVSLYKLAGLSLLFPKSKIFNKYALGYLPEETIHEVDVLAGAYMMVKKTVLNKVGSFDEQFFMYAEDIDLSYRIQQAGYKNYYLGNVTIVHFKGESTKRGSLNYIRMFYNAMRLFVKKHYSGTGAWIINKGLYAGILLRQMVAALALLINKLKANNRTFNARKIFVTGGFLQAEMIVKSIKSNHPEAFVQHVKDMIVEHADKENLVVFCTGRSLTYKKAIQLSQTCKNFGLIMWSGNGTRCIVGSGDKNAAGNVWLLN